MISAPLKKCCRDYSIGVPIPKHLDRIHLDCLDEVLQELLKNQTAILPGSFLSAALYLLPLSVKNPRRLTRYFTFLAQLAIVAGLAAATSAGGLALAADLKTLLSFDGANGANPRAGLIRDASDNLLGTTYAGGANCFNLGGCGTVFEIAKTAGGYATTLTTLVSLCALPDCADGTGPPGGLLADTSGNLVGTTFLGGAYGSGAVFKIAKTTPGYASSATPLFSFKMDNGGLPLSGLIADANGNLFGTTSGGGANCHNGRQCGTAFEIPKTAAGYAPTPETLVNFCMLSDCADGAVPQSALIVDAKGNLFGTTYLGGTHNRGTVFEIVKTPGGYAPTPTTLASFNGVNGANPSASLIADAAGNLFGTTFYGGSSSNCTPLLTNGCGTVFKIDKTAEGYASTPTILVDFNLANGAYPSAGLIADSHGNLFGMTEKGGAYCPSIGCGTLFELTGIGFVTARRP
jgi:uncharacterized protein YceK